MKLRNKKTGEIEDITFDTYIEDGKGKRLCLSIKTKVDDDIFDMCIASYDSLSAINADWEDYIPQEPLIKDKNIRKAVRAWAELNGLYYVVYDEIIDNCHAEKYIFEDKGGNICIQNFDYILGLEEGKTYTITELCGEEDNENQNRNCGNYQYKLGR